MIQSIPKVQTTDRILNQIQENLIKGIFRILQTPMIGGKTLKSVSLNAGTNTINHGLGYALSGWFVTRIRAQSAIYDEQDSNQSPDKTLVLNSQNACTVDLYVW